MNQYERWQREQHRTVSKLTDGVVLGVCLVIGAIALINWIWGWS